MNAWVTAVITLSAGRPSCRAAVTPRTTEMAAAMPRARTTRLSVIQSAGSTWSATGVRLV